ncbi:MAG: hypothetical protein WCK65_09730 [Rhodospirillaceae bacterium]
MTNGTWVDTAALVVVGLVCVAIIGRRLLALFVKSPSSGCSSCSKCGGAGSQGETKAPCP